ncbi:MAG: hypothetical protein ABIB93_03905 [Chloroflexota bacterium]
MLAVARFTAPVLLIIGTAGLLGNEFAFHWGRPATLIFAACNILGLVIFLAVMWRLRGSNSS